MDVVSAEIKIISALILEVTVRTTVILTCTFLAAVTSVRCIASESMAVRVLRNPEMKSCSFNRVIPKPDGTSVAIFEEPNSLNEPINYESATSFAIIKWNANREEYFETPTASLTLYGTTQGALRPLSWDGQTLSVRMGRERVGRFASDLYGNGPTEAIETQKLHDLVASLDISFAINQSVDVLWSDKLLFEIKRKFKSPKYIRRSVLISNRPTFFAVDRENGQSAYVADLSFDWKYVAPASTLSRMTAENLSGEPTVFFLGKRRSGVNPAKSNYSLPAFNLNTGKIFAFYQPNGFDDERLTQLNESLRRDHYVIRDAATVGDTVFALAVNQTGLAIFKSDTSQINKVQVYRICNFPFSNVGGTSDSDHLFPFKRLIGIKFEGSSTLTGVLFRTNKKRSKGVIIVFHGGPASASEYEIMSLLEIKILRSGFDILKVDYSGSIGGGLENSLNLRSGRHFGFDIDADAIGKWLAVRDYDRVNLLAISFGALPALNFLESHGAIVGRRVFVGPLLQYPNLQKGDQRTSDLTNIELNDQIQFEIGLFGGVARRDQYVKYIWKKSSDYKASNKDLFVFGKFDHISPMSSASRTILNHANVFEDQNSGHEFLLGSDAVSLKILEHFQIHPN